MLNLVYRLNLSYDPSTVRRPLRIEWLSLKKLFLTKKFRSMIVLQVSVFSWLYNNPPLSRSMSIKSVTVLPSSTSPTVGMVPARKSNCSVTVVFPASMWAMTPMFRILFEHSVEGVETEEGLCCFSRLLISFKKN